MAHLISNTAKTLVNKASGAAQQWVRAPYSYGRPIRSMLDCHLAI